VEVETSPLTGSMSARVLFCAILEQHLIGAGWFPVGVHLLQHGSGCRTEPRETLKGPSVPPLLGERRALITGIER
jgi:hypothetical protein